MKYYKRNFSRCDLSFIQEGDEFEYCNLKQNRTTIGTQPVAIPRITARHCNLENVFPADGSVIEDCNDSQIDRCYWLNPRNGLDVEPENCRHVVDTKTVEIDGVVQPELTEYVRQDYVYPRWRDR